MLPIIADPLLQPLILLLNVSQLLTVFPYRSFSLSQPALICLILFCKRKLLGSTECALIQSQDFDLTASDFRFNLVPRSGFSRLHLEDLMLQEVVRCIGAHRCEGGGESSYKLVCELKP